MNKDRYPIYALAAVAGAAVAVWAGLPPLTLLFLLVCPVMMLVMMRGMANGQKVDRGQSRGDASGAPRVQGQRGTRISGQEYSDGSHERIDNP